jgi:hypothetical protein
MWGYQTHFRAIMKTRAKQVLAALGADIEVKALLVGVCLPEVSKDHPVCIEPEDGEWDIADFKDVHTRTDEIFNTHPDQHLFYGDEPSMLDKSENIRLKSVRIAIEEVLSRTDLEHGTYSFCGSPVRVGNFHVAPILQAAQSEIDAFPRLSSPIRFQEWISTEGIVQALISHLLAEASDNLGTKEPGRFIGIVDTDCSGLLRKAGKTLCNAISLWLEDIMLQSVFENMNKISELRYEGEAAHGTIIFSPKDLTGLSNDVLLHQPISLDTHKLVRKIVEISDEHLGCICQGSDGLVGLRTLSDFGEDCVFRAVFTGHYRWALYENATLLMNCAFGVPSVPQPRLTWDEFFSNVRRIFAGLTIEQSKALWDAVSAAMDQRHGTMLVVSDEAASESQRLGAQAIAIEPMALSSALVARISGIDGAILVDRNCECHAFGVILDGIATNTGDPSRGARYNSACRYISSTKPPVVCLVVSEDGYVNMVPTLRPQIRRHDVERHVSRLKNLTSENYHSTQAWLDDHRFYLTSEQCDVVNTELSRIHSEPQEVGEIRLTTPVFRSDPEMNETYYLDES